MAVGSWYECGKMCTDRAQAYTLEAILGGLVIAVAVLFALNATVVTPSTSGAVGPEMRENLRQQADDVLATAAEDDSFDLSGVVRYWDPAARTFYQASSPEVGYGSGQPPGAFGRLLNDTFTERGYRYNVEMSYLGAANDTGPDEGSGTVQMVFQGEPDRQGIVATHRVTLFDNQTLSTTQMSSRGVELWQLDTNATDGDDGYYPVPDAIDGPVYNVVEVRVIVW
jgi:hypothetical protein